ncbi:hypothetical protein [Rhizobium aouanii]|uniref:Uncharacterized protein n=1 Tax=Rhizobium aouanii TaxID=3118145 RepID=A0ABU8CPA7_9HYPH
MKKRNAVRCPGHPSKDRSRHGESLLRVNAKSRSDPSTKLAQASVNECRHLPGMFNAHIENDGITCPYAQALLRHALYQAIEMRSWSNLQCRWRVFVLILQVERDLVDFEALVREDSSIYAGRVVGNVSMPRRRGVDHHIAFACENDVKRLRDFREAIEDHAGSQKFGNFLCDIHGVKLEFAAVLIPTFRFQVLSDNQS